MVQQCAPTQVNSDALRRVRQENLELQRYLQAQRVVIASLERRVGRSLESLGVHLNSLTHARQQSSQWTTHLTSVQGEVDSLCDLLSDTLLLQKLEAGKVEIKRDRLDLQGLLRAVTRHLLNPSRGRSVRLICDIDPLLPPALADLDLTEAVLTDLLARGLKYSDPELDVLLTAHLVEGRICLQVLAQRFAPPGNRDFATEIILCCRRVEVQQGEIHCIHHPDGLQTVTISLPIAPDAVDQACRRAPY